MGFVTGLHHTSVPMPPDGHAAARKFYGDILQLLEIKQPSTLAAGSVVWFRAGEDGQEVHVFVDSERNPNSTEQHLCLQVTDIEKLRARLVENKVTIRETTAIANRPRFFVRDPFNNLVELTQITGAYE
jgi:catechol 2,3-dioxygenase-like lactoylglutathione lyase family enzyme